MSADPAAALNEAGIAFDPNRPLPFVQVVLNDRGEAVAPGEEFVVQQGETEVAVKLPEIRALLTGDQEAPDFQDGVEAPYDLLFAAIEGSVADFCATANRNERDREVQRVYRRLRDRPDGTDRSKFLAHIRAVFKLFLSLEPLSREAYEAVLDQLLVAVRRLAHGKDSANYVRKILASLAELEAKQIAAAEALAEATQEGSEEPEAEASAS